MGVPVVTLVGSERLARRMCQLFDLGLSELAGETAGQFVRIAVELARFTETPSAAFNPPPAMERSPLMDASTFARTSNRRIARMWHTWCETVSAKS